MQTNNLKSTSYKKRKTAVAPMLDWTDRHCRYFHRLISRNTWLYTEMVTTGALIHGDVARHLDFSDEEHPIALQLGGSEPADLAHCARLGQQWGYNEINLNCGCPSERVQKGAFGACLMKETPLVVHCIKAIQDAVDIDVSIKHRIGVDDIHSYDFVRDFMGEIYNVGCRIFIVHARNAILKGLSPKENRDIPPLQYDIVHRLKTDFPDCEILINGGIETVDQVAEELQYVDGVMIGRAAYHNPYLMASFDEKFYGDMTPVLSRAEVLEAMIPYIDKQLSLYGSKGLKLQGITRHLLGLMLGMPGARRFRQILSDAKKLAPNDPRLLLEALEAVHKASGNTEK
jgi:tRNA-dihydrouridine synthase A